MVCYDCVSSESGHTAVPRLFSIGWEMILPVADPPPGSAGAVSGFLSDRFFASRTKGAREAPPPHRQIYGAKAHV